MIQLFYVRPLHPALYVARVGRALSADRPCEQLAAALQHRADHDDRRDHYRLELLPMRKEAR